MKTVLTVTEAFGDYAKGDQITDHETMETVAESHPGHVVRSVVHPHKKPAEPAGDTK